jgi:hypothetical protein
MAVRHLRDPDLRRLRALKMIDMKIRGKTYKEIAEEFGVGTKAVKETLSWAKKAELVVKAEDKVLAELVPAAHDAFKRALAAEDPEVAFKAALEIFKGTLPGFTKAKQSNGPTVSDAGSLSSYIDSLRNDLSLDGEVLPPASPHLLAGSPLRQITAGEAELAPQGLSEPAPGDESTADAEGNPVDSE